ncbi:AAA family ATPase [Arthrobacter sp. TMP15]|uniref:AAA family ATPase n=1 Tax=Arthrobacter sp. TMP15 TaxID=3140789 RepID=UPI0031BB65F5
MRIHRLEIQAFGPFAGREIVDFDKLGAQGLFLLNGSTGAGKTSVLDAIAYALYGRVPGARQGAQNQLRSHHAAEGVVPEVVCEFSAGGRRLEVRRSPEWMRPLKRGTGTTREQASTQLREKTAAGWEVKSARNDESAAEIQDLLGMNMAQFTKVVLLAQGDFAAFLRASAEERQVLLQKLFGTDVYKDLENRLATDSKTAQLAVAAGLGELAATEQLARGQAAPVLAANAAQVAEKNTTSNEPEASGGVEFNELHGSELFEILRVGLALGVDRAMKRAKEFEAESESLVNAVAEAESRSSRHKAFATAVAERERLEHLGQTALQWRHQQEQHHQAQVLAAVLATAKRTGSESERAQRRVAAATAIFDGNDIAGALLGQPAHAAEISDLERYDRELSTRLGTVDGALPDEARLLQKTADLIKGEKALAAALTHQDEQASSASAAKKRLSQVLQSQEKLRPVAQTMEHSSQDAAQAQVLVVAIEEHQRQNHKVSELAVAEANAREVALSAKERWLGAFNDRLNHVAGELAANLVDGEPCQVCGSKVHPAPSPLAGSGADLVRAEKVAKSAFEAAEGLAVTAGTQLAEAKNRLVVLAERGGESDLQETKDRVQRATLAHGQATEAASELAALSSEAVGLQIRIDQAQTEMLAATGQAASLGAGTAAVGEEIALLQEHLAVVRDGYESLLKRRTALVQAQIPGQELLGAVRNRATAEAAKEDAADALEQALADSAFDDVEAVQAALLTPAAAAALDKDIKGHARAVAVNADRLAMPEIIAAQVEVDANIGAPSGEVLAELAQGARHAQTKAREGALALGLALSAAEQLRNTAAAFQELERVVAPLREKARMLAGLSETVRGLGDNNLKMTLTSYVLAARLEQVAEAASTRLATMSDARYTLRHSDAKSGNKKSGLGLEVVDQWTGMSRDTATLSGGESFMASLALALGLSDVVQYESGGLDIETLFVDEGFGSLDEDSLEQVMEALESLRDGGRMVGLVSHVEQMKQRIPLHLHVNKGRHGSTLELRMAGAAAP